jgi:SAM-dependent methyltransferase
VELSTAFSANTALLPVFTRGTFKNIVGQINRDGRETMYNIFCLVVLAFLSIASLHLAEEPRDPDLVWNSFLTWFKTAPPGANPIGGYADKLKKDGVPPDEIQRQTTRIIKLFSERPEAVEILFDRTFVMASGNPTRDGFNSTPSSLMMEAIKGIKPGTALDAGMGQGRNAIYLAQEGWDVTGFDISGEALKAAKFNSQMAGVRVTEVKAGYDTFDFGKTKWDLILLIFAWAPIEDPGFLKKLIDSLRPGGMVIFEHYIDDPNRPQPRAVHALLPGQLRTLFNGFKILRYEETEKMGDWGGHGEKLVRMVARKP